jgi:hypothetical protein
MQVSPARALRDIVFLAQGLLLSGADEVLCLVRFWFEIFTTVRSRR